MKDFEHEKSFLLSMIGGDASVVEGVEWRMPVERPGRKQERVDYWQEAAAGGDLYAAAAEAIPSYEEHDWNEQREHLADERADSSVVLDKPVFQFYQAAAAHRVYVLRDLLPTHGLLGN